MYKGKKLIKLPILLLFLIILGCKTGAYISSGPDTFSYLKLCKNGKYMERYSGHGLSSKYTYGFWTKSKDTIILQILFPRIYYSYDSLAFVKEKKIKDNKNISIKVRFPDTIFGFSIKINGNEYSTTSDTINIAIHHIHEFEIHGSWTWMKYTVKDSSSNYFIITFHKNYLPPPVWEEEMLLDPPTKYIKHGKKLHPLNPYTNIPYEYNLNNIIFDKYKYYKDVPFCNYQRN